MKTVFRSSSGIPGLTILMQVLKVHLNKSSVLTLSHMDCSNLLRPFYN